MEECNLNKHTDKLGKGFSRNLLVVIEDCAFVAYKFNLKIRVVGCSNEDLVPAQTISTRYYITHLDDLFKLKKALAKTKFEYSASGKDGVLNYEVKIKLAEAKDMTLTNTGVVVPILGVKRPSWRDWRQDSFIKYCEDRIIKSILKPIDFDSLEIKARLKLRGEISREWCEVDHIIANALSEKDNNSL